MQLYVDKFSDFCATRNITLTTVYTIRDQCAFFEMRDNTHARSFWVSVPAACNFKTPASSVELMHVSLPRRTPMSRSTTHVAELSDSKIRMQFGGAAVDTLCDVPEQDTQLRMLYDHMTFVKPSIHNVRHRLVFTLVPFIAVLTDNDDVILFKMNTVAISPQHTIHILVDFKMFYQNVHSIPAECIALTNSLMKLFQHNQQKMVRQLSEYATDSTDLDDSMANLEQVRTTISAMIREYEQLYEESKELDDTATKEELAGVMDHLRREYDSRILLSNVLIAETTSLMDRVLYNIEQLRLVTRSHSD